MIFILFILVFVSYVIVLCDSKMQPFIVGGMNGRIEDFPYSTHISIKCINALETRVWNCGGSIINQVLTLTAAHCLTTCNQNSPIVVSFGHENVEMASSATARHFIIHDEFSEVFGTSDIALIRLNSAIVLNSRASRVVLMGRPPYREEAMVAGWGYIDEIKGVDTNILKYTKQYVWERKDCRDLLQTLPKGTICARSRDGSGFAAVGDSGSALVVRGYIQIGLVSHKLPVSASVAIYTDTGYFYKWIQSTANKLMCT